MRSSTHFNKVAEFSRIPSARIVHDNAEFLGPLERVDESDRTIARFIENSAERRQNQDLGVLATDLTGYLHFDFVWEFTDQPAKERPEPLSNT